MKATFVFSLFLSYLLSKLYLMEMKINNSKAIDQDILQPYLLKLKEYLSFIDIKSLEFMSIFDFSSDFGPIDITLNIIATYTPALFILFFISITILKIFLFIIGKIFRVKRS